MRSLTKARSRATDAWTEAGRAEGRKAVAGSEALAAFHRVDAQVHAERAEVHEAKAGELTLRIAAAREKADRLRREMGLPRKEM